MGSEQSLKYDLSKKLVFNDGRVFERLRMNDTFGDELITACATSFPEANQDPIKALKAVVRNAERAVKHNDNDEDKVNDECQDDVEDGGEPDDRVSVPKVKIPNKTRTSEEKRMYHPLGKIFSYIESFEHTGVAKAYNRHFISTGGTKMKAEHHSDGFPEGDPDFTCRDHLTADPDAFLWRNSVAFAEVKSKRQARPQPSCNKNQVLPLVAQSADYGRLHMSARPFQLFTVGLLIFGSQFCVAIYDRDGITFSPTHDIWDDALTFIKVVRRISCDLSPAELGQDSTAQLIEAANPMFSSARSATRALVEKEIPQASLLDWARTFPSYLITLGGDNSSKWVTLGPPIWSSLSMIGRGTSVWRVCPVVGSALGKSVIVMKNAWRSSFRSSEASIYESIIGSHPAVAKYSGGGDVRHPGRSGILTVRSLRTGIDEENTFNSADATPILHRVFLETPGRPLQGYRNEAQLLKGLSAAIRGHRYLHDRGILHGDVSIGNVLLSNEEHPNEGAEGFICDLEYASVQTVIQGVETTENFRATRHYESGTRKHIRFSEAPALHGGLMTGTLQFMAIRILEAIIDHRKITQEYYHDLESFIWVLAYAIGDRLAKNHKASPKNKIDFLEAFKTNFGQMKIMDVLGQRGYRGALRIVHFAPDELVSPSTRTLCDKLEDLVYYSNGPRPAGETPGNISITYNVVLNLLSETISELEW